MPASTIVAGTFVLGLLSFLGYALKRTSNSNPLLRHVLLVSGFVCCGGSAMFLVFIYFHLN